MIGGVSGVVGDVIPYGIVVGERAVLEGLNVVGMRRRNFTKQRLQIVRNFYQRLFHGAGTFAQRLESLKDESASDPAVDDIIRFLTAERHRPLCLPRGGSSD
jgi:UDP-N-acetylglucosamine acyltransferase